MQNIKYMSGRLGNGSDQREERKREDSIPEVRLLSNDSNSHRLCRACNRSTHLGRISKKREKERVIRIMTACLGSLSILYHSDLSISIIVNPTSRLHFVHHLLHHLFGPLKVESKDSPPPLLPLQLHRLVA